LLLSLEDSLIIVTRSDCY